MTWRRLAVAIVAEAGLVYVLLGMGASVNERHRETAVSGRPASGPRPGRRAPRYVGVRLPTAG
jgi:hypothetical protein